VARPIDNLRLAALLLRISRPWQRDRPDGRVAEELDLTAPGAQGAAFDLYRPARGQLRSAALAIHGVSALLGRDPRLEHFARGLARSGVACAVPSLADLAIGRWSTRDLDRLEAIALEAERRLGTRVGLIGFSYGGSYALVTAARAALADRIRYVLGIGAYHDLAELFAWYVRTRGEEPVTAAQWDDRVYLHLILAQEHTELLPEPERLGAAATELLRRFCTGSSSAEKRAFFEQHLRPLDLVGQCISAHDPDVVAALSPAGNLAGLRCPVSLIHDAADSIVPPEQGRRLIEELQGLPGGERHGLLVTTLLSHVDLGDIFNLRELRRLFAAMAPILAAS